MMQLVRLGQVRLVMNSLRAEFPVLKTKVHGKPLVYLDSAASTQKPLAVIEAMDACLREGYSNVHRGVHALSQRLSAKYEAVRAQVADFLNAEDAREIVFCKGTTDALNLLANSLGALLLEKGDKVLLTAMEHHANIVPWQMACQRFGAELVVLPMDARGVLSLEALDEALDGVKIFAMAHVSNVLGTVNPIREMVRRAKEKGVVTIVDGAQAVAHLSVDVRDLGCDFYVFSGHKLYGPTAVGVLYGRYDLLEAMPPYQGGGDMILSVSFEKTLYAKAPLKFEAGTPAIVEVIGLGAALNWLKNIDFKEIARHEHHLYALAEEGMRQLEGVRIYGEAEGKSALLAFSLVGIHPHDAGTIMDDQGVAVRVGHHCAEPVMHFFKVPAMIRASFALYNNEEDVERFLQAVKLTQEMFQ